MRISKLILQLLSYLTLLLCTTPITQAAEPSSEPILRIDPGEHIDLIRHMSTDKAGHWLVTAADNTARIWSLPDGRLIQTLRIPILEGLSDNKGVQQAVTMSTDGRMVAVVARVGFDDVLTGSIFLFDRASGTLIRRLKVINDEIISIAFSPDGASLAVGLIKNGLQILSVANGQILAQDFDYRTHIERIDFSADGRLLTVGDEWRLYRFDGVNLSLLANRKAPEGAYLGGVRFSPDGRRIAASIFKTIYLLDGYDLSFKGVVDTTSLDSPSLGEVEWSSDGEYLYGIGGKNLHRWSGGGTQSRQESVAKNGYVRFLSLADGRLAFSGDLSWGVLDKVGNLQIFNPPAATNFNPAQPDELLLSVDGTQVQFGNRSASIPSMVFDVLKRSWLQGGAPNLFQAQVSAPGLEISNWKYNSLPRVNGVTINSWKGFAMNLAVQPRGSWFILSSNGKLHVFDSSGNKRWTSKSIASVYQMNISRDCRWIVTMESDGVLRWYRASDGIEQLAFFPHADKKRWVMWTPSGYYDASPGAEELIGWHVNRGKDQAADFFPASRFRERFYRPDVLSKVLETQDEAEAVRIANTESGRRTQSVSSIAQVLPPVVEIVSPASENFVQSGAIKVRYTVRTAVDAPVTAMRVRVNGLLQSDTRALRLVKSDEDTQEIEVTLPEQDAEIQLFAENKYSTSKPAILRLKWAGKVTANQAKPKLYVLAVGVSKYKNPEYNLGLASKDANDFVNSLNGQKGKLYSDVVVKLLTDDKATKDDVLEGLDWLKQQVTSSDVGIMFVAGHGMNDKLGNYYFLPHNANPEQLIRTGVSQNDIKQTFASLPGHTVFFIDTCYSGGAMGNVRTSGFVNDLASAENGAVVFTASSAGQLSQENSAWGNGAFTKSVVEGLNGSADFRKSGFITAKGLDYYVDDRVKTLTKGQQTPVSISPGGVSDFPIAAVGN